MNNIWKLAQECGFDDYELIPMLENFASKLAALQSAQPAAAVSDEEIRDALEAAQAKGADHV